MICYLIIALYNYFRIEDTVMIMRILLNIIFSISFLTISTSIYSSTADKNALQSRLLDIDVYIDAIVDEVKNLARQNAGKNLPEARNKMPSSNGHNLKKLTISKDYKILIQFDNKKNYNSDEIDDPFYDDRIILVPLFAEDNKGRRSKIISSWSCLTDIAKFNDDLLELKNHTSSKSPIVDVTSNKYLSACQALPFDKLDKYWGEKRIVQRFRGFPNRDLRWNRKKIVPL